MRNVPAGTEELHCGTPPRRPVANVNVINIDGIYIGKESDPSSAAQSFLAQFVICTRMRRNAESFGVCVRTAKCSKSLHTTALGSRGMARDGLFGTA